MTENSLESAEYDFVAKDIKHNRICVRGRKDNFKAIKSKGKWKKGYPEFEELIDNFSEEKDLSEIQKLSSDARGSL